EAAEGCSTSLYARNLRHPEPTSIPMELHRLKNECATCLKSSFSGSTSKDFPYRNPGTQFDHRASA
ncbi:MAG TPA: hypothetical protein VGF01_16035, partial [Terracidiphilus sp.]